MKEIIGYIRVSTSKQVGKDKNGLEAQLTDISYWLESKNIDINDVDIICDSAKSASSLKRNGFQTIVERVKKKQVKLVIAQCSDRLFRNVMDTITLGELFKSNDVEIQLVRGEFDYSTSNGKFNTNIKACVDQNWVDKTREDTFDRMKTAAHKGHYILGGKCPIGYRRKDKKLEIVEDEKEWIIEIFRMLASNQYTFLSLSNYLNSKNALGLVWDDRKIEAIVSNKIYYGCLDTTKAANKSKNGYPLVIIEDHSPAMISKKLWDSANNAIIKKTGLYKYLFKNMVKCSSCRSWCTHSSTVKPKTVYLYYCCDQCKKRVNETVIFESVHPYLQEIYEEKQNDNGKQILARKIQKYKDMLKSLEKDFLNDIIEVEYFETRKKEWFNMIQQLNNEKEHLELMKVKKFVKLDKLIQKEIIRNSLEYISVNFITKDVEFKRNEKSIKK